MESATRGRVARQRPISQRRPLRGLLAPGWSGISCGQCLVLKVVLHRVIPKQRLCVCVQTNDNTTSHVSSSYVLGLWVLDFVTPAHSSDWIMSVAGCS